MAVYTAYFMANNIVSMDVYMAYFMAYNIVSHGCVHGLLYGLQYSKPWLCTRLTLWLTM